MRHLLTLEAIAEEGSFVRAAEKLGYVQSAISQQLAGLEAVVGARLVNRSRGARGAQLTEEGVRFLRHTQVVLGEMRAAARRLDAATGERTVVRLAAERAVSPLEVLPAFTATRPNAGLRSTFEFQEGLSRERVLDLVESGEADAGCLTGEIPMGFDCVEIYADRWVAVMPGDAPGTPIRLQDVARSTIVALRGITHEFPGVSHLPAPSGVADTPATLCAMVRAQAGVAVVPESLLAGVRGHVLVREIESTLDLRRTVFLVWRNRRPIEPIVRVAITLLSRRASAAGHAANAYIAAEPEI